MIPLYISRLLSERFAGEEQLLVLVRKHTCWYTDKQNWQLVSPAQLKAGGEI